MRRHSTRKILIRIFTRLLALGVAVFFVFAGIGIYLFIFVPIPDLSALRNVKLQESVKILDRNNTILFDFSENIKRDWVPIENFSQSLLDATIATEDKNFYGHYGIRPESILRSLIVNLSSSELRQGGSTITQQVVKNLLLTPDKKILRKLKEIVLAIKIDSSFEKKEILEIYLNAIPYGGTIYGASEASRFFFSKEPGELTVAESSYLAALPRAPSYYSPFGNNIGALEARKNYVLRRMLDLEYISREEFLKATNVDVSFGSPEKFNIKAPHFVFFVKEQLERAYGEELSQLFGSKIVTTLDFEFHDFVQNKVTEFQKKLEPRIGAENIGAVVLDAKTGEILSMVGSRGYFDEDIDGKVNATFVGRQPGSSFKPFVYATAFSKGFLPESILFDVPTQFSTSCEEDLFENTEGCYSPQNYTGKFVGPVALREALAQSLNLPAVKTLHLANIRDVLSYVASVGITTLNKGANFYGLSLVLGSGDVRLLEMVNAYATFANNGDFVPYKWFKSTDGDNLDPRIFSKERKRNALSADVAKKINSILSDDTLRSPVFGTRSNLYFKDNTVAVKTGTTNNQRDIWIIGYTPDIVVGLWAGNNNGDALEERSAGVNLAPLWRDIVREAVKRFGVRNAQFLRSTEVIDESLAPVLKGVWWNRKKDLSNVHSILHSVNRKNVEGGNGRGDSQYDFWETGVREWSRQNQQALSLDIIKRENKINNNVFEPQNRISILSPEPDTSFEKRDSVTILYSSPEAVFNRYDIYVNEKLIGTTHFQFFIFSPSKIGVRSGDALIRVIGHSGGTTSSAELRINID